MSEDRTMQPTPQRRERANRDGQVARGSDVSSVSILLGGAILVLVGGGYWWTRVSEILRRSLTTDIVLHVDEFDGWRSATQWSTDWAVLAMAPMAAFVGIAILTQLGQVGWHWRPDRIAPDWQRLQPGNKLQRLVSSRSVVDGLLIALRLAIGCTVAASGIWAYRNDWLVRSLEPSAWGTAGKPIGWIVLNTLFALAIVALFEYGWKRWQFEKQLHMTAEEARAETKEQQGDLRVRSLQRGAHRKMVQGKPFTD